MKFILLKLFSDGGNCNEGGGECVSLGKYFVKNYIKNDCYIFYEP